MVPIDFYSIGGDWKLLGNSILQIIFLCIQQKKETHTGVNDERIVMFGWIIFLYCFLCCCTLTQFFFFFLLLESGLSMLEPRLEWLVALVMLETLSDECCLRMRRSGCAPGAEPLLPDKQTEIWLTSSVPLSVQTTKLNNTEQYNVWKVYTECSKYIILCNYSR